MFVCCHALPSFDIEYWAGPGFEDDMVGLQDFVFFGQFGPTPFCPSLPLGFFVHTFLSYFRV